MPHVVVEYTKNLEKQIDFLALFQQLHQQLHTLMGSPLEDFKSRAICLDKFLMGDGVGNKAFIAISVYILDGRPLELKQKIGETVLEFFKTECSDLMKQFEFQLSVYMNEWARPLFFKYSAN